jgi:hypothetical protein
VAYFCFFVFLFFACPAHHYYIFYLWPIKPLGKLGSKRDKYEVKIKKKGKSKGTKNQPIFTLFRARNFCLLFKAKGVKISNKRKSERTCWVFSTSSLIFVFFLFFSF